MKIFWKPFRDTNIEGEPIVVECDTFNRYGVQLLAMMAAMPPGKPISFQAAYTHWVEEASRRMFHTEEGCAPYVNKGLIKALQDEGFKIVPREDEYELVY